jgi:hypothetical protein
MAVESMLSNRLVPPNFPCTRKESQCYETDWETDAAEAPLRLLPPPDDFPRGGVGMEKKAFDEIDEETLFWLSERDAPQGKHHCHGPYKKRVYLEFHGKGPEYIYVRRKTPSLSELLRTQRPMDAKSRQTH